MRVLVTGGYGFIGSHLVDALLARGDEVVVLDNVTTGRRRNLAHCAARLRIHEEDLRDAAACRRAVEGCEAVFHQAALGSVPRSMDDPATSVAVNVTGTANLLAACRDLGVRRVVYASSSSVYGDSAELPKREGREGRALSPYALSKQMDEQLAATFARCFGSKIVGLRYFNVYGPRQDPEGPYAAVIPRFFRACVRGEAATIHGDGEQTRDFTYVADVVDANLRAAAAPDAACGRAYNVCAGRPVSVNALADAVAAVVGRGVAPHHGPPRAGDVEASHGDRSLAEEHLGLREALSLEEGLVLSSSWYLTEES